MTFVCCATRILNNKRKDALAGLGQSTNNKEPAGSLNFVGDYTVIKMKDNLVYH